PAAWLQPATGSSSSSAPAKRCFIHRIYLKAAGKPLAGHDPPEWRRTATAFHGLSDLRFAVLVEIRARRASLAVLRMDPAPAVARGVGRVGRGAGRPRAGQ